MILELLNFSSFRVDALLTIKIADFGLTKDVYSTEYYRVNQHIPLPVKWMSLESLLDGYFDEKTDVVRAYVCNNIVYLNSYMVSIRTHIIFVVLIIHCMC